MLGADRHGAQPALSLTPTVRKSRVARQPEPVPARLVDVSDTAELSVAALGFGWLEELYRRHAAALLRLAVLLTRDRATAEDVVHDAFVALHRTGRRPRPGAELAYLRRTVTNLVVGRGRRAATAGRARLVPVPDSPSAEAASLRGDDRRTLADAVRLLPDRQRACVVLRYWADLGDAEIAATLGISVGAVKSYQHRARATLAGRLEDLR
jgi:RNA polymerase sigma-70 factor (sigma-E family)